MARPSTPLLSVERIAATALELVDTTGELAIAPLARALGVRPSSLYHHVAGRDMIVEAMRSAVFADVPVELGSSDPEHDLARILHAYRDAFARHPRVIPMLTAHTVAAPEVLQIYSVLATALARWGVTDAHLLDAVTILDCYVIGAALDVAAPEEVWARSEAVSPALQTAIARAPAGRERADRSFELGLQVLLSGLDVLRR